MVNSVARQRATALLQHVRKAAIRAPHAFIQVIRRTRIGVLRRARVRTARDARTARTRVAGPTRTITWTITTILV